MSNIFYFSHKPYVNTNLDKMQIMAIESSRKKAIMRLKLYHPSLIVLRWRKEMKRSGEICMQREFKLPVHYHCKHCCHQRQSLKKTLPNREYMNGCKPVKVCC